VLNDYHHGDYRFETQVRGLKVDDVIDHSSSQTFRHHHVSSSTIREALKLVSAEQVGLEKVVG
jgi:hypothetical protein